MQNNGKVHMPSHPGKLIFLFFFKLQLQQDRRVIIKFFFKGAGVVQAPYIHRIRRVVAPLWYGSTNI